MEGIDKFLDEEMLQKLADNMGVAAEFVWVALNRQVLVEAIGLTLLFLVCAAIVAVCIPPGWKALKEYDEPWIIILVIPTAVGALAFYDALVRWINPNYVVLQMIQDMLP